MLRKDVNWETTIILSPGLSRAILMISFNAALTLVLDTVTMMSFMSARVLSSTSASSWWPASSSWFLEIGVRLHRGPGVSILMSYGENPHYVKLPIFSEFMENSTKFMNNSDLTNGPKICARRTKTDFKDRGFTA